jgi:16S rRNA (guanine527-N7)-methyltransferase
MSTEADAILAAAARQGAPLETAGARRLADYLGALLGRATGLNLTAARDAEQALAVLVEPSLVVARAWPEASPPSRVLDLGSGNGFPGVVAAALWPAASVWLVERRGKKARAIRACLEDAAFPRVEVLACDAREVPRLLPDLPGTIDLVTVRAVGALEATTRMAAVLLAPGGRVVHWKAADLGDGERRDGARAARALGLGVLPEIVHAAGRLVPYGRGRTGS